MGREEVRKRGRFQSTLPARGATHLARMLARSALAISIHAPRTGSDNVFYQPTTVMVAFQSTLPARGATFKGALAGIGSGISIHAPRTGSDRWRRKCHAHAANFNPRSPHGERQRRN